MKDGYLGRLIRTRRLEMGLTGVELGRRIGRSRSYVCQVEGDYMHPNDHDLKAMGDILGLDYENLTNLRQADRERHHRNIAEYNQFMEEVMRPYVQEVIERHERT